VAKLLYNRMKRIVLLTLALLFACALSACHRDQVPIRSAIANAYHDGKPSTSGRLSDEQVKGLNAWFEARKWGWLPVSATRQPKKALLLQLADGTAQGVSVFECVIEVGRHERRLSPEDAATIAPLIVIENGE
jgi:hypothetical protein